MAAAKNRGGRPRRLEPLRKIYLRQSVQELWRNRKESLGYTKLSDSEFAEVLLHACPVNRVDNINVLDNYGDSTAASFEGDLPEEFCSTPAKKLRTRGPNDSSLSLNFSSSFVDVTGTSSLVSDPVDPFSETRVGNESNPFVMAPIAVCNDDDDDDDDDDDGNDLQEFNERLSRIILDLETSSSDGSISNSESDAETELSLDQSYAPSDHEEMFVVNFDTSDGSSPPRDSDATVTILNPELDKTSYHEDTVITEQATASTETDLQSTETLQAKLKQVYANVEEVKRELVLCEKQKVVVTLDKVMELIPKQCKVCDCEIVTVRHTMSGATVVVEWKCSNGHADSWASSEILTVKNNQKVYVNNVQLSAAILLSGNNYQKFNLLAKFLGLASISESVFYRIQKLYCCPAIKSMWNNVKEKIHGNLPANGVTLAGDGRNDSPGHTARYCVYTLMDEASKLVVDLEVIDKRETGGKSAAMEKLALARLLRRLKDVITINHLVTDASTSVKALVREMKDQHEVLKDLIHDLDIWHKSAKLVKALTEASNLKDCGAIRDWIEPIRNHFWFCCQQAEGDLLGLKNKWFGVLHHVVGEHEWHDGQCSHGPLTAAEADKPLLEKGSKAMDALRKIVMDKRWVESLIFYIWFKHTSFLENFNSMMLKYAPKRNSFDFLAFCIRMLLAALDHNMHASRPQATTKDGKLIWKKQYSKRTKRWHPEPVKADKTFEYIPYLIATILKARVEDAATAERVLSLSEEHPRHLAPTIALRESPELIDLVQEYQSRFYKKME